MLYALKAFPFFLIIFLLIKKKIEPKTDASCLIYLLMMFHLSFFSLVIQQIHPSAFSIIFYISPIP